MKGIHYNREEIEKYIKKWTRQDDGCLVWQAEESIAGFGTMRIEGAVFAVRRVVWWLKHGYLPQGKYMKDTCGSKLCCNPAHLTDATPEEDRREKLFRGAYFNRARPPRVKPETAALVWEQLLLGQTTLKEAAKRWGTSVKTLRKHIKRYDSKL